MLQQLTIQNFAIIDRLDLQLAPGLNILTGETGAGKSIVIDAVSSLLGSRLGPENIRAGTQSALVEAIFDLPEGGSLGSLLDEMELADPDEGELIVSRSIRESGRSSARVNGRALTLAQIQALGANLIDIHGQSEHLSLLRVGLHIEFLDGYANLKERRAAVALTVASSRSIRREISELLRDEAEIARRLDLLSFQVDEIDGAKLEVGEEEELRSERNRLANAEKLSEAANTAYSLLYEGSTDEGEGSTASVIDLLGQAGESLRDLARLDADSERFSQSVAEMVYSLEDITRELRSYRDEIEYNPERLEYLEERLDLIKKLKRKYGGSVEEVIAFGEKARAELEVIGNRDERLAELRQNETKGLAALGVMAEEMSQARAEAGLSLAREIEGELKDLNMARSSFQVGIRREESAEGLPYSDGRRYAFDSTGADRVEFLISTNPGEPPKPLAKIASGGEASRLMLALKTILARADLVPVLIFDEIDVGIGGRSGFVVGQKLAALSRERQVICVTHLPQIACFADAHYSISKAIVAEASGERTATRVRRLSEDERIDELAVMLGGQENSQSARANAMELIERARQAKKDGPAEAKEQTDTEERMEEASERRRVKG